MKFVAVARAFAVSVIFATNVCAAPEKNNLRKLSTDTSVSFLEAKPAPEECETGKKYCACRDGTQCNFTSECEDLGVGGSCDIRTPTRSNGKSCRNGDLCMEGNTACEDGSKCKVRDGDSDDNGMDDYDPEDVEEKTETIDRNLEEPDEFAEAQPEQPGCRNRTLYCTCRDGSTCSRTTQCTNRGVNGSCDYRPRNRNNRKSCRNGEACINSNTACRDGSACRIRDGIFSFE